MTNYVRCASCDYFKCSVCQQDSSFRAVHYHFGASKICIHCHTIIFTIAGKAAHESISVHELKACGGTVVAATKELNTDQSDWWAMVADNIQTLLEDVSLDPRSPFNKKSKPPIFVENQKGWCAQVADEIVALQGFHGSDPIRDQVQDILERACGIHVSRFNHKSKT